MSHDVLYTHTCRDGRRRAHTIQYHNADHETMNLANGLREHWCHRCNVPMDRVGPIADVIAEGPEGCGKNWLSPLAWDLPLI